MGADKSNTHSCGVGMSMTDELTTETDIDLVLAMMCREDAPQQAEAAYEALYDRHAALVWNALRKSYRGSLQEADLRDVMQATFAQVWEHPETYDEGRGTPRAWLFQIAYSRAKDCLRGSRRKADPFDDLRDHEFWSQMPVAVPVEIQHELAEPNNPLIAAMRSALTGLSDREQDVLRATAHVWPDQMDDDTRRHLAETLGTTESNVRTIRSRALKKLRRKLEATGLIASQENEAKT